MVQCLRHTVLAHLKQGAGLPFFFPLLNTFSKPLIAGAFFCPGVRR
ncbi:pyr operon leader peptide [Superficieibacter sp. 1612_C1]|nr:pyr operon leader peptide [Superficieibacter sp. 1612_C1]